MGLVGYYYILTSGAITSPTATSTRLGFKADESAVKEGNHGYCTSRELHHRFYLSNLFDFLDTNEGGSEGYPCTRRTGNVTSVLFVTSTEKVKYIYLLQYFILTILTYLFPCYATYTSTPLHLSYMHTINCHDAFFTFHFFTTQQCKT